MSAPDLSVIVPSFGGESRLPRTLGALQEEVVQGGFELLVIDDGSTDGTARLAGSFDGRLPLRVIVHDRNRGRAAAVNTGIREARGRIVLILDDDMQAERGLLGRHLAVHAAGTRHGVLGRIVHEGLDATDPFHEFLIREEAHRRRRLLSGSEIGFGEVWTGQFSVDRHVLLASGLYDEEIRIYGLEDIELAYRLERDGVRFVYLDDAVTHHAAYSIDLGRDCARHRLVGEVAAYVARRHDTPEMRRYLRLERSPPAARRSMFHKLMDVSAVLLRRRTIAGFLSGPVARPFLSAGVRLLELGRFRRALGFAYSFMRDIEYFSAMGSALSRAARKGDRNV